MALPTYAPSLTSSVTRVQQASEFPQFVVGGVGNNDFVLLKKSTSYIFQDWRSKVFTIGKNFDVLKIKFSVVGGITANKVITPVLYFDNGSSSSVGTVINTTNYPNSEKLITLSSKNFSNTVHGRNNFFLELQFSGSALAVVKLPIEFELEVEDI